MTQKTSIFCQYSVIKLKWTDVVCEEEQLFSVLAEEITAPIGIDLQSNKVYDTAVTGYPTDRHFVT